jgi:oligopeptide/dipeptide ABC transporter ATP-binding protein
MRIKDMVGEPLTTYNIAKDAELRSRVIKLLQMVGLKEELMERYPHQLSGGQCQRVGIARALALNPTFIVLDEPTSALDVSVQAQILNLLQDLQEELNLTYLFISHNFSVINHVSARVAVMYMGKIIEVFPTEVLFSDTRHPYTQMLLNAVPFPDPRFKKQKKPIEGEVETKAWQITGCRFYPRCTFRKDMCREQEPELRKFEEEHFVACHFAEEMPKGFRLK